MNKFTAIIATANVDDSQEQFSPECLRQIDGLQMDIADCVNLGQATLRLVPGERVQASVETSLPLSALAGLYVVPTLLVKAYHMDGEVKVIDKCRVMSLTFTRHPTDRGLEAIKA